jgi:hypothetical protein
VRRARNGPPSDASDTNSPLVNGGRTPRGLRRLGQANAQRKCLDVGTGRLRICPDDERPTPKPREHHVEQV